MQYGDLISVVVPVYNRADSIGRSVGSLCNQSYRNLEIILVDDCSKDDLVAAVAALGDPRVRVVRRAKNGGAGAARNTGVAEARAEWIAFHDSDDICVFDRIERQVRALLAMPEDHVGVYSSSIFYTETSEATYAAAAEAFIKPHPYEPRALSGDAFDDTVNVNFINVPTMLIRRAAFVASGGFDERLRNNEDWDFTLRLTRLGKFGFLPDPLLLVVRQMPKAGAGGHISINDHYSARSFVGVLFKLRRVGVTDRQLYRHYLSAARFLMRSGRFSSARRFLGKALKVKPLSISGWRLYGLSHLPRLYAWLRSKDNRPV